MNPESFAEEYSRRFQRGPNSFHTNPPVSSAASQADDPGPPAVRKSRAIASRNSSDFLPSKSPMHSQRHCEKFTIPVSDIVQTFSWKRATITAAYPPYI
jgi:hypothetical protein